MECSPTKMNGISNKNLPFHARKENPLRKISAERAFVLLSEKEFDIAVGAFDFTDGRIFFPTSTQSNLFPLLFRSVVTETLKARAIRERAFANARHGFGNLHARKARAIPERAVANARHGIGDLKRRSFVGRVVMKQYFAVFGI